MLAGRVLIISEVAGLAPHVAASGCGIVVAPTVKGIQSGMQQLLERRDQWSAMGLRGRDYALKRLDWSVIAQESLEQYRSIVLKTGSDIPNSKIDTHENPAINQLSNS
jgi:glycosyltransferase involved in cell wall biosynthesis